MVATRNVRFPPIADAKRLAQTETMNNNKILDDAIAFAADRWEQSSSDGSIPPNINLRDRVNYFARPFRKALLAKYPELRTADDQVFLLVVGEGIAQSETVSRDKIEKALGIILPPKN